MTANDWILPWFMLVRIMYIMLNWIWVMRSDFPVVVITSGFQNIKPLLFHDWPVHTGYRLAGMQVCRLPHLPCVEESGWQTACKWTPLFPSTLQTACGNESTPVSEMATPQWSRRLILNEHYDVTTAAYAVGYESLSHFCREYSRMFGESPKRDITKVKKVCRSALINPALICLEQFRVSYTSKH